MKKNFKHFPLYLLFFIFLISCQDHLLETNSVLKSETQSMEKVIPLNGNAVLTQKSKNSKEVINNEGLQNWTCSQAVVSVFLKFNNPGTYNLQFGAKILPMNEKSTIKTTIDGNVKTFYLTSDCYRVYTIGSIKIDKPKYVRIDFQGVEKTGAYFGELYNIIVNGLTQDSDVSYNQGNDPNYLSGSSPRLDYRIFQENELSYFYNEVKIPNNANIEGAQVVAVGHNYGSFGFILNSESSHELFFSSTTKSKKNPVRLVKKASNAYVKEMSEHNKITAYLPFKFEKGKSYKFIVKGEPDYKGNTIYTSWVQSPNENKWQMVASFASPDPNNQSIKGFYSMLKNLDSSKGHLTKIVEFSNAAIINKFGTLMPITRATFKADELYLSGLRSDVKITAEGKYNFSLQTAGFFDATKIADGERFQTLWPLENPSVNLKELNVD